MTILTPEGIEARSQLPAFIDRNGVYLRDNPFDAPTGGRGGMSVTTDDQGLIGVYPYSGVDIKLVVHLPPEDPRATDQRLNDLLQEQEQLRQALEMASTEGEITQMESQLQTLRTNLTSAHELLAITDPEAAEYSQLESDIESYNTQIAGLTNILNTSLSREDRSDLQIEIQQVTAAIEALRDSEGSGVTSRTKTLAEIQTLSISDHREKVPVRTLGTVFPRSFTRGGRTIGGSIVFTTFHQHVMSEFLETSEYRNTGVGDWDRFRYSSFLMDQLPPLDISISFANEYGNLSWMAILGVEFLNEGQVMSIEDLYIEGTAQYVARDFDPIRNVANRRLSRTHGVGQRLTGTSIMMEDLRRRVAHRNIPWI